MKNQLKAIAFILLAIFLILWSAAFYWRSNIGFGENVIVDSMLFLSLIVAIIGFIFIIKKDDSNH